MTHFKSSTQTAAIASNTPTTSSPTQFYTWKNYRCAYEIHPSDQAINSDEIPLILIHPIGVGLSRHFWQRFCQTWYAAGHHNPIYNPDLLGCGESDMPRAAYLPEDWADQLHYFLQTVVQKPVILVVQGALFPVAIALYQRANQSKDATNWIRGLVLAGPPAWAVMTKETPAWQERLLWSGFNSPLGDAFYRYARRSQFLRSFSIKELFAEEKDVDAEWLEMLEAGAADSDSRHAVFSFLAGFWRRNYETDIQAIAQPTLVVVGDTASSISQVGKAETPDQRIADYVKRLPQGEGCKAPGRNVLPYESTTDFVRAIAPFIEKIGSR